MSAAILSTLALVLQLMALWVVMTSAWVSQDRMKLYALISDLPPRINQGPIWVEMLKVTFTRHWLRRVVLRSPEPLFQSVYSVIVVQLALENLRLDYLRRLWIDQQIEVQHAGAQGR